MYLWLHVVIVHVSLDVHVWSKKAILLFVVTGLSKSESTWQQLTGITTFTFPLLPKIQVNRFSVEITTSVCTHNSGMWKLSKLMRGITIIMSNPSPLAKMFHVRMEDVDLVTWHVSLNESDRHLLAPTIAAKPPPPTAELTKCPSRFSLPSESLEEKMRAKSCQRSYGFWSLDFLLKAHICTI